MSMKGLTVFIADLRNCRARELEEKRINKEMANIRNKFRDGNLNGYQKKKYVCKLLYIYILGWDVDFGHMEALNLISSSKYSEKQIGYLAMTLLLTENSDLIKLVISSIRKDLEDYNEIYNCLALHAIANIGGREMAESLSVDVQRLLVSSQKRTFVKKKAALCMLRLFRKHSDIIPAIDWAELILFLMDDQDLGVTLSVTSLITSLAQQYPEAYEACIPKAIDRLYRIVIEKEYTLDYLYYKVPIPWLQVKLLRLLQYYPPPKDNYLLEKLNHTLQAIINNSQEIPKNIQHNNAQNAVLFEAINLAIHIDSESHIVSQAAVLLGKFISSKETNTRYLGLETMCHLAGFIDSLEPIKKHQNTIIMSLKDKDISVRRKALDLLYSMCDNSNAEIIVTELLKYLQVADYAIKEELVLKIAILTEKYATEYSWYVDIMLQLISIAGDFVSDEVWYRIIQIVTNNEDLQEYAARTLMYSLKSPICHETTLKVAGYILGEFGHLIANEPGCSPIEQFTTIHSKFGMASLSTRALLLSTYIKFINLFPEIKSEVTNVFKQYSHVLDVELQQRACEYLAISNLPTDDLLQTVFDEMPPFPERESILLSSLHKKIADTEDKRIWVIGGKDANKNKDRRIVKKESNLDDLKPNNTVKDIVEAPKEIIPAEKMADIYYNKLMLADNGILYEDSTIQLGIKSEYHNHLGRIALFAGNKTQFTLTNFIVQTKSQNELKLSVAQPIDQTIPAATQLNQLYNLECNGVFNNPPVLLIRYQMNGMPNTLQLQFPVSIGKFLEPIIMNCQDFFTRWRQIGGPPRESQIIFKTPFPIDITKTRNILTCIHFGICENVDPNKNNFVGAAVFHSIEIGKIGCLLRLEPNLEQQMYRLTLRTTNEAVTETLRNFIERMLCVDLK